MTVIACSKCGIIKGRESFYKNNSAPGGLRKECKKCSKSIGKKYRRINNNEVKERISLWNSKNKDKIRVIQKRYSDNNRELRRECCRKWQKNNKAKDAARSALKRANIKMATPAWANHKYIELFYRLAKIEEKRTGKSVHVDHMYPINSPLVCGLHVEDNLQLLFSSENISKKNKLIDYGEKACLV